MTSYNTQDKPTVQTVTQRSDPTHPSTSGRGATRPLSGSPQPQGLCTASDTSLLPHLLPQAVNNHSFILISSQALHHTSPAFTDWNPFGLSSGFWGYPRALGTVEEIETSWHSALGGYLRVNRQIRAAI